MTLSKEEQNRIALDRVSYREAIARDVLSQPKPSMDRQTAAAMEALAAAVVQSLQAELQFSPPDKELRRNLQAKIAEHKAIHAKWMARNGSAELTPRPIDHRLLAERLFAHLDPVKKQAIWLFCEAHKELNRTQLTDYLGYRLKNRISAKKQAAIENAIESHARAAGIL